MLALEFEFLAGRFHATPWGSHLNEGAVEWPPSPWRLQRALIAGWQLVAPQLSAIEVESLLIKLAAAPPCFHLPPSRTAHTRHYVPTEAGARLMLDAFVVMQRRGEPVVALWPDLVLEERELALLDNLVRGIRFLGRSESWCRVRRTDQEWSIQARPLEEDNPSNRDLATLLCPEPRATLAQYRETTASLHKGRWNRPPGSRWVTYKVEATEETSCPSPTAEPPTLLVYQLRSPAPIPRSQTLLLADRFRRQMLTEGSLSPTLSGKQDESARQDGHLHLHILPDGLTDDIYLDRVILWAPEGFSEDDLRTLLRLRHLPGDDKNGSLDLLVSRVSGDEDEPTSQVWQSFTPYLPTRRSKANGRDSLEEQLTTECQRRGFPTPAITRLDVDAPNYRVRRGPRPGPGGQPEWLRLEFPHAVRGPLCLGASSHFGMGRFKPDVFTHGG